MDWWIVMILLFGGLVMLMLTGLPIAFAFVLFLFIATYFLMGVNGFQQIISSMADSLARFPIIGISDRKWELVTKYRWGPTFYSSPSGLWYNLDKWKSLTDQQRKALDDAAMAAEKETALMWDEDIKKDWAINEKAGVKIQSFSPEDEKKYLDLAYDEGWKAVLAVSPGMSAARPMMEKK